MKVAIVHDWLTTMAGAERVVLALHDAFPDAPIYTSVYNALAVPLFDDLDVRTSFLQRVPFAKTHHRLFPVLRRLAFESFDFSEYDVVISSASAEAKGIMTKTHTVHICYCHTPTRYYWVDTALYLKNPGFGPLNPIIKLIAPAQISRMRIWDYVAAQRVDQFIANSSVVAQRIRKFYGRSSRIVHPPISPLAGESGNESSEREGFLTIGRQVPYKRFDLAVEACSQLSLPLTVIGDGVEHKKLTKAAGPTVRFVTDATDRDVAELARRAKALIFPGEEDFGISMAEALGYGCPVIAYGKGGSRDIVTEGRSGVFFDEQSVSSLVAAIRRFDEMRVDHDALAREADRFSRDRFVAKIRDEVDHAVKAWHAGRLER